MDLAFSCFTPNSGTFSRNTFFPSIFANAPPALPSQIIYMFFTAMEYLISGRIIIMLSVGIRYEPQTGYIYICILLLPAEEFVSKRVEFVMRLGVKVR